jgi:hypothetical protein
MSNWSAILEWGLLILFLLGLTYAALAIREEHKAYEDTAKDLELGPFRIYIPSWWGVKILNLEIECQRLDTRYDWVANFKVIPSMASLEEVFSNYLNEHEISFDENQTLVDVRDDFFSQSKTQEFCAGFLRVEGTATIGGEERAYLDFFLYHDELSQKTLLGLSHSSVLNGCVEGPYFEEALKNLEIIDQSEQT